MTGNLLPDGWYLAKLGDLCRIELGSTPARKSKSNWDEKRETENVWLSIADMPDTLHAAAHDSKEYVSQSAAKRMKLVPKGTLLVSFKLTLGRLCYAGRDLFTNEAIAALHDLDEGSVSKQFLYWYLTFFDWQEAAAGDEKVKGKTLNKAKLKELEVWLPPLEQQKRIVAVLDQAFAALHRARSLAVANLADAEELFDSWLTAVFHEHPRSWKTAKLRELCNQITVGHVGPMAKRYSSSGTPFLRSQNVRPFRIDLDEVKFIDDSFRSELKKSELRPGDVAIVRTGYPGTAAVIPDDLPLANCADLVIARPKEELEPEFLAMFLNSSFGKKMVAEKSVGAAQKHFNVGAAKEVDFAYPDLEQQKAIVEQAKEMRGSSEMLAEGFSKKAGDIDDLRQSLLQKAFAGELT